MTGPRSRLVWRVGSRGSATIVGQFAYRGSSIVLAALAARTLIQNEFGELNVGITMASMVLAGVMFGFDTSLLRDLSAPRAAALTYRGIYVAKGMIALPLLLIALASAVAGLRVPTLLSAVLAVSGVMAGFAETPETILAHRNRWWARTAIMAVPALLSCAAGAMVSLMRLDEPLLAFGTVYLGRDALRLILGLYLVRCMPEKSPNVTMHEVRQTIRRAAPFAAVVVLGLLYFRVDVLVMQLLLGAKAVAEYAAGYALLTGVGGIMTALGPLVLQGITRNPDRYRLGLRFAVLGGACFAILTIVLAPWVLPLVFGDQYRNSVGLAQILALSMPFSFANSVSLRALYATRRESTVPAVLAICMVFNLLGNCLAMPAMGAAGAAIMTVATEALLAVRFHRLMSKGTIYATRV